MGTYRDGRQKRKRWKRREPVLPAESERRLAEQADVIGYWQLRGDGLKAAEIEALVEARVFKALPGRALTTRRAPLDADGKRWRALLAAGRPAWLTSLSTLHLFGIREDFADPVHVVVRGPAMRKTAGVRRHRSTVLEENQCVRHRGFPTAGVPIALVDAAADSTADELAGYLDRAVMLGRYDGDVLQRAVEQRGSFRGRPLLLDAIGTLDASSGRFRSEFERRLMNLVKTSTVLPPAVVNVIVENFRPDFRFIGTRSILECDGRDYHRSQAQILADAEREKRLNALGFVIFRLRWAQLVYEPERTLARIEAFVLANLAAPTPARPGAA